MNIRFEHWITVMMQDRLQGDQITLSKDDLTRFSERPTSIALNYIKKFILPPAAQ